jgi:hypothetical protein
MISDLKLSEQRIAENAELKAENAKIPEPELRKKCATFT